jgi:hypothetical protein
MVAAAMKSMFLIQAPEQVRAHWHRVTEMLRKPGLIQSPRKGSVVAGVEPSPALP